MEKQRDVAEIQENDVRIIIPTYKRAGDVSAIRHIDHAELCVAESEQEDYAECYPDYDLLIHPDSVKGDSAKRQWIIEQTGGDIFLLDDDSQGMQRIYRKKGDTTTSSVVGAKRAYEIVQHVAMVCRDVGAYHFGFAPHPNPASYRQFKPFTMGGYTPGGAMGILSGSNLFFPTETTLPIGDYWICCLNAHFHRYGWYDGRFAWSFRETMTGAGGNAEYRQEGAEKKATEYLKEKFGKVIVPKNHSSLNVRKNNPGGRSINMPYTA